MTLTRIALVSSLFASSFVLSACDGSGGTGVYRGSTSVHVGYGRGPWSPWYRPPIVVVPPVDVVPPDPGVPIQPPITPDPPIAVPLPSPDFGGDFGGGDFGFDGF